MPACVTRGEAARTRTVAVSRRAANTALSALGAGLPPSRHIADAENGRGWGMLFPMPITINTRFPESTGCKQRRTSSEMTSTMGAPHTLYGGHLSVLNTWRLLEMATI